MASFDENGKYIKTNWKAGDKITATKLNKIEESIEAVNDNDISRHVEADTRLDALEAKDVAHDKEFTNIKNTIADNKAAAELGDYDINSRMTFLENELNEGIEEVHNVASTVDGKIAQAEADMAAMVAEVESEMNELQNDLTNAQTQTFTVTNAYKFTVDHDGMMPSLVTLDNIEGLSTIETNNANQKFLVHNIIHDICTIDIGAINYFDYSASTEIVGNATFDINNKSITITGDKSQGWSGVKFNLDNLTEGKRYCLFCDNVTVNSGGSGIEIVNGETNSLPSCYLSNFPEQSTRNIVFTARANTIGVCLFCTAISGNTPTQGSVTYENIQIYEVKEMTIPDIQLNSLPNGVKDEIKDGMLIKRTGIVNLADLTWTCNSDQSTFAMYYSKDISNIKCSSSFEATDNNTLCNMFKNSSTEMVDDPNNYSENIISSHWSMSELKIKISKNDCPSKGDLNTWLRNNNVQAVYELAIPEYIPVNLNIKADKGDTVVINTTKTMDLTYDVQLNTRAQIDSIQDLVGGYLEHGPYLPLSGGAITGDLSASCFESIRTVESTDGGGIIGSTTKTQVFIDQYGQGRFRIENSLTDTPLILLANPHDCSYSVNGNFTPAGGTSLKLGSGTNRWSSIYLVNNPNVSSGRVLKENIEYIGESKSGLTYEDMYDFIKDDLGLATYNFIGDDKLRMNFIAQDLLVNADGTDNKVGQMIVNPVAVPPEEEIAKGKPYPTLSYDTGMYTSVLAGALKEAINKIEQLEARIQELENK